MENSHSLFRFMFSAGKPDFMNGVSWHEVVNGAIKHVLYASAHDGRSFTLEKIFMLPHDLCLSHH